MVMMAATGGSLLGCFSASLALLATFAFCGLVIERSTLISLKASSLREQAVPAEGRKQNATVKRKGFILRRAAQKLLFRRTVSNDDDDDVEEDDGRIRNINLVLVGDTLMRQQYLDLVYYLKYGNWTSERSPFALRPFNDPTYCNATSSVLKPEESVDCYFNTIESGMAPHFVENRYFTDESRRIFVSFLGRFGVFGSRLRFPAQQALFVNNDTEWMQDLTFHFSPTDGKFEYQYTNVSELIDEYIAKLIPQPEFVVLNEGLWPGHGLHDKQEQDAIQAAIDRMGSSTRIIYKTTTSNTLNTSLIAGVENYRSHDARLCQTLDYCFNVSWTDRYTGPEHRWYDGQSFTDSITHQINQQFLALLNQTSELEYQKQVKKLAEVYTPKLPANGGSGARPRNLNIVMAGDSLMRYQYLDFAYYLKYGVWPAERKEAAFHVRLDKSMDKTRFMSTTHAPLIPEEACDCFEGASRNRDTYTENRYYYDPIYNNRVTFLGHWGQLGSWGHWKTLSEANQHHTSKNLLVNKYIAPTWKTRTMADLIRDYVAALTPRPDYVIYNEGMWPNHTLHTRQQQDNVLKAFTESGLTAIYKTSTDDTGWNTNQTHEAFEFRDPYLCRKTQYCFNISWALNYQDPEWRWDRMHFKEPVNEVINKQMLKLLEERYRVDHGIELFQDKGSSG